MERPLSNTRLNYLKELDGLRCIAVSAVMIGHWTYKYSFHRYTLGLGIHGVNLFFVLSGFLISRILIATKELNQKPSFTLKQFYIRRALRIFPIYYLVLLIAFILNIPNCRPAIGWLLTYTSNIRSFFSGFDFQYMIHFWSLSVEEQFYIFFPLLVLITPKKHLLKLFSGLTVMAILSRVIAFHFIHNKEGAEWVSFAFTPCCFDCFSIGAILAYLFIYKPDLLKRILKYRIFYWICFLVAFITYLIYSEKVPSMFDVIAVRFLYSVFCFWLIGKASLGEFKNGFGAFLLHPAVIYLGRISYGIYIFHNFMSYIYGSLFFPGIDLLYFVTTVALASLSLKYFEKPINDLKRKFKYA